MTRCGIDCPNIVATPVDQIQGVAITADRSSDSTLGSRCWREMGAWIPSLPRVWVRNHRSISPCVKPSSLMKRVSDYIGNLAFLWLSVDDPPSPSSDRARIEAGDCIAELPIQHRCRPSVGGMARTSLESILRYARRTVERQSCRRASGRVSARHVVLGRRSMRLVHHDTSDPTDTDPLLGRSSAGTVVRRAGRLLRRPNPAIFGIRSRHVESRTGGESNRDGRRLS